MSTPHPLAAAERLARMARKRELALGVMGDADRQAALAFAAIHFAPAKGYDEKAVNAVLIDWLARGGAMLHVDHVELRRWLVDAGWLERDGFGRRYALAAGAAARAATLLGDVSAERLTRTVEAARADEAAQRQARRRRHLSEADFNRSE